MVLHTLIRASDVGNQAICSLSAELLLHTIHEDAFSGDADKMTYVS